MRCHAGVYRSGCVSRYGAVVRRHGYRGYANRCYWRAGRRVVIEGGNHASCDCWRNFLRRRTPQQQPSRRRKRPCRSRLGSGPAGGGHPGNRPPGSWGGESIPVIVPLARGAASISGNRPPGSWGGPVDRRLGGGGGRPYPCTRRPDARRGRRADRQRASDEPATPRGGDGAGGLDILPASPRRLRRSTWSASTTRRRRSGITKSYRPRLRSRPNERPWHRPSNYTSPVLFGGLGGGTYIHAWPTATGSAMAAWGSSA